MESYSLQVRKRDGLYWIHENSTELTKDVLQAKVFYSKEAVKHWIEFLHTFPEMKGAIITTVGFHQMEFDDVVEVERFEINRTWDDYYYDYKEMMYRTFNRVKNYFGI